MANLEPIRFAAPGAVRAMEVVADGKNGLPVFKSSRMMVRELATSDAATLLAVLRTEKSRGSSRRRPRRPRLSGSLSSGQSASVRPVIR
jgi:hypothetical protein